MLRCEPTAKGLPEHQMLSAMCSNRPDSKLHKMGSFVLQLFPEHFARTGFQQSFSKTAA